MTTIDKNALREERIRRMEAPLNGNAGFCLLKRELDQIEKPVPQKPAPRLLKGFDIRIQRDGGPGWANEKAYGLAPEGELPAEWAQICADPTVIYANIFPSSQRNWTAAKRRLVAVYNRESVTA